MDEDRRRRIAAGLIAGLGAAALAMGTWATLRARRAPLPDGASAPAASLCVAPAVSAATNLEGRLLEDFQEAYPAEAPPAREARSYTLTAAPAQVQLAGRALHAWAFNGTVPGPTLRVRLGEALRVELRNELPQPTTIHWHGVRVPNRMDGVPGVTQDPVPPGAHFIYEFTPKDAGTFWFHPHLRSSEQVERGLHGVLVVEDPVPLPYTQDLVWVLDDVRLDEAGQIDPAFNTRGDLMHDGRWGQAPIVNGVTDPELTVRSGERIRLRLVNTANGRVFAPDLGGLEARIIAVDGMYAARPLDPAGFEIAPGNRVDLDITFGPEQRGRRVEVMDRFTRTPFRLASIRVLPEEVPTPRFQSPARAKVPRWEGAEAAPVYKELVLNARRGGELGIEWTINDEAHAHHHPIQLPWGRWIKLRFTNASPRIHPMHLHGHFFKVLARDGRPVDEPFWRDTALIHRRETVDVGLVPLDEGVWMLHCHILEHAESGMMTLVEVRRDAR